MENFEFYLIGFLVIFIGAALTSDYMDSPCSVWSDRAELCSSDHRPDISE